MHQTDTAVSAVNTTASDFVFRRDEVPVQICKISVKYTCIGRSRDTRCLCVKYPSKTLVETVDNGELIPSSPVSHRPHGSAGAGGLAGALKQQTLQGL
jgi:hypothetical protein